MSNAFHHWLAQQRQFVNDDPESAALYFFAYVNFWTLVARVFVKKTIDALAS